MDTRSSLGLMGVILLAVIVGVMAAQSQPKTVAAPAPTIPPTPLQQPPPNQVDIVPNPSGSGAIDFPHTVTVRAGTAMTWVNADSVAHSVTADNGAFNQVLSPGEKFTWKPKSPGRYAYACYLHPNETGTVIVRP
jgi:plastocyanin